MVAGDEFVSGTKLIGTPGPPRREPTLRILTPLPSPVENQITSKANGWPQTEIY
jgi:hypothetical protein